jgi:hypothetical protein
VKTSTIAFTVLLMAGLGAVTPARAAEMDSCRYILIADLPSDKHGIAGELRDQARTRGVVVVSSQVEVPESDVFRSCVMVGDWQGGVVSSQLAIRVFDAVSGTPVASATLDSRNWWGIGRSVKASVGEIYRQLEFTGYNEDVYQARMRRLYPPRPTFRISEADVRERPLRDAIEGIWTDGQNQYRLAIIAVADGGADYLAVVLQSKAPLWQTGEVKAEFTRTDSPSIYSSTYFMLNKQPVSTTFTLENGVLRTAIRTPVGQSEVSLVRSWPAASQPDVARE